ncbi:MAG TPA: polyprenyl synthetase family protein [Desulfobacterales bacterium]
MQASTHIEAVTDLIRQYTVAPGLIGDAADHHLASGGKRFRPLFALAVGLAVNADPRSLLHLAAAVEMLHNASLVHDDLQDKDELRRGRQAVWRRFGPETAVNLGDYFIAGTYSVLARMPTPGPVVAQLVALFADSTRQVIAGQSAELAATRRLEIGPEDYRDIARGKSGVLMALPVVGALRIAKVDPARIEDAREAMLWLGVAYQIQDDLADLFGLKDGRPPGVDLREGRMSLPILHYWHGESQPLREAFAAFIRSAAGSDETEIQRWLNRLRRSPAVDRCRTDFYSAVRNAENHLEMLPPVLRGTLEHGKSLLLTAFEKKNAGAEPGGTLLP